MAASSESGSRCSRDGLGTIASSAASTGDENSGSRRSPDGLGTISLSLTSGVGGEGSDSFAGPITVEHYWSDDSGCDQVAEIGTSSADGHTVSIRSSSGIMSASSVAVGGDTRCCMPSGVSTGFGGDSRCTHRSLLLLDVATGQLMRMCLLIWVPVLVPEAVYLVQTPHNLLQHLLPQHLLPQHLLPQVVSLEIPVASRLMSAT